MKKHKKKQKSNKNKRPNQFNCLYNSNDTCGFVNCYSYCKKCVGSNKCQNYKVFSDNRMGVSIKVLDTDIIISIKVYNIDKKSFLNYNELYELFFKSITIEGIVIYFRLTLFTIESYIIFIFNELFECLKRDQRNIVIEIKNPKEILDIVNVPYSSVPENIKLKYYIKNQYGEFKLFAKIPKSVLFSLIDKSVFKKLKTEQNVKKISNKNSTDFQNNISLKNNNNKIQNKIIGVTAIVINDNRKCLYNSHYVEDVRGSVRIVTYSNKIINYYVSAAYCSICDKYFILKNDFDKMKKSGIILCPVENKTKSYLIKKGKTKLSNSESRIHQLGYNVKKGSNYTSEQRKIVLANIIENTDISKFEIQSNISRCIKQHQTQPNYAEAVLCWKSDYEFVSNYNKGDIPEVIIEKIKMGR